MSDAGVPDILGADDAPLQLDQPVIDDGSFGDPQLGADLDHTIVEVADMDSDPSGFDIF
jgi:hypothetical protein